MKATMSTCKSHVNMQHLFLMKLRAIEEVFEVDEQGCSSSGSSEIAEGRRQALARAHAHAQKTLAEGFAMQEALSKIALSKKIKWRTRQVGDVVLHHGLPRSRDVTGAPARSW
jgi:hypothetical protein